MYRLYLVKDLCCDLRDSQVQKHFIEHVNKGETFIKARCLSTSAPTSTTEASILFEFCCMPPKISFMPLAFMAKINIRTRKVLEIVDPYTGPSLSTIMPTPLDDLQSLSSGIWNQSTQNMGFQAGQLLSFQVLNANVFPATITISDQGGPSVSGGALPATTVTLPTLSKFGNEPMSWNLTIDITGPTVYITWNSFSTWVPGDPSNP
jgi:hypothetical protein